MSFIYCFTNKITGKKYIGQAVNPQARQNAHKHCALKRNSPYYFHRSIRKHGWDNFEFEIIEETESPNDVETKYIKELNTHWPNGYNELIEHGGMPDITKQKISATKKTKWQELSEEVKEQKRKQARVANLGNQHSEETKKKISESTTRSLTGRKLSDKRKQQMSSTMKQISAGRAFGQKTPVTVKGIDFDSVGAASAHFGVSRTRIRQWAIGKK